jgi:catechol 2,3-dioxygenase-like lactoylglutathione lyase family enzyme
MKNDWEFDHVGLVVRNLAEISAYYPSLGIGVDVGPLGLGAVWPVPGSPEEERRPTKMTLYGKPFIDRRREVTASGVAVNTFIQNLQVGSLVVEGIMAHPEGNGMNDDFFRGGGEGISHICFNVPDPEKETAALVKKGCDIVMNLEQDGKIVENYLGTGKQGNIWLSFRPMPDKTHRTWQAHNRAHPLVSNWQFRGIGVVVRDLDKALAYYRLLGIAAFQPEIILDSSSSRSFKVHGLTGSVAKARTRTAMVGSIGYEFMQPLEKETTFGEYLSQRPEGACSLDFTVKDLAKESARLTYRGIQLVLSGKMKNGNAFAYFDTRKVGNLMVKLVQA